MRLSIFARLNLGYLVLFSILAGLSLYFIYHLGQFNTVTHSIIVSDTSVLEYSNQLTDALLSEARFDRKYAVLKDEELYLNAKKAGDEFNQLLNNALMSTNSQEIRHLLYSISVQHANFTSLVNGERDLIRGAKPYSAKWYAEEKKKNGDDIIDQLREIRQTSDENVYAKIVTLNKRGDRAKNVSILICVLALSIGLLVAFIITRSITKPLDVMLVKTVTISQGKFRGDLEVKSPPEIAELAAALNTMSHKLQEVDDIKSDFFSHMSHELRTPLASIKEGTSILLEGLGGEISEKQKHILQIIIQECNRLIELVNSLLDLSKMEAGMLDYQFSPTDLAILVKQSLQALGPLAEAKNIAIENTIGAFPPVNADQERIMQVLHNIVGNAIKFSRENGKIRLEAVVRDKSAEVSVHDTGIGIPEEDLERIFNKFQQVIRKNGSKTKGTGLGLATVKQIILAHGGKVWATSQAGQGSTFYFTLPLAA